MQSYQAFGQKAEMKKSKLFSLNGVTIFVNLVMQTHLIH